MARQYLTVGSGEVEIGPTLAAVLLGGSSWVVSAWGKVEHLAGQMLTTWRPSESVLLIDTEGGLVDGVHRLNACLFLNRPFRTTLRVLHRMND